MFWNAIDRSQKKITFLHIWSLKSVLRRTLCDLVNAEIPTIDTPTEKQLVIKFLVPNKVARVIVGDHASAVSELVEVTNAIVKVSRKDVFYPGTNDRIVILRGKLSELSFAQSLIWNMFSQKYKYDLKNFNWSPKASISSLGVNDDIFIDGKFTIPAALRKSIIGPNGNTIHELNRNSGARINVTDFEESSLTRETTVSITGSVGSCIKCTDAILKILNSKPKIAPFANRGFIYKSAPQSQVATEIVENSSKSNVGKQSRVGEVLSVKSAISNSFINLTIADEYVEKIENSLTSITSLSGAEVVIASRENNTDGKNDRNLTITGSSEATQTAHLFINQLLRTKTASMESIVKYYVQLGLENEKLQKNQLLSRIEQIEPKFN